MSNFVANDSTAQTEKFNNWHSLSRDEIFQKLKSRPTGLTEEEAAARLIQSGPNNLRPQKHESLWEKLLEEIREPMILLLLGTGILYSVWGELSDALTIFAVIFTLIGLEIYNERRAEKAIAALGKLAEPTAPVLRNGHYQEIKIEAIGPGDVILLQAGRRVPADARLIESFSLALEEAALTGEALPVEKEATAILPETTSLAERSNLVFAGSSVSRGRGRAIVYATGGATELARIAALARGVRPPRTPLQIAMRELTRLLVGVALGFSVLVPLLGWLVGGQPLQQMILVGLSLAFATIPEEMPILITLVLALGGYRLSRRRAIVKRLRAVESLGAITVIATDKTGTLTQNRMQVSQIYPESQQAALLEVGVLCNEAIQQNQDYVGDALEVALLRAALAAGLNPEALRQKYSLVEEFSFDNQRKRMSSVYAWADGRLWVVAKGAPEAILPLCALPETEREAKLAKAAEMAGQGWRILALASAVKPAQSKLSQEVAEQNLNFIGLVAFSDPPRSEAAPAIAACRSAGIRPIMITGDHPLTARKIAAEVGLDVSQAIITGPELDKLSEEALSQTVQRVSIFARTTPEHKLRIVQALSAQGERVAVTGDGINDAPALAAADVGVAMGQSGTDVAREAADIVLADDNFATLVAAVAEGRVLFANLKKAVRYYLACKVALIGVMLLPTLLGVPVPFAPIQIILLELFMDLAASATFIAEPAEKNLMNRPPHDPKIPFMDKFMISSIFMSAAGLLAAVAGAYLITWYNSGNLAQAQTVAFVTWLLGHVLLALNMRSEQENLFRLGLFSNKLMLIWGGAAVLFLLVATFLPFAQSALKTTNLSLNEWLLSVAAALLGTFWLEVRKLLLY